MPKVSPLHGLFVFIISLFGALVCASLVLAVVSLSVPLHPVAVLAMLPGMFLFQSFSWMAFYVPLYLFLNALMLKSFSSRRMVILMLTLLPFLTLSLLCKLLFPDTSAESSIVNSLQSLVGAPGGAIFLGVFSFFQIMLILVVARFLGKKSASRFVPLRGGEANCTFSRHKDRERQRALPEPDIGGEFLQKRNRDRIDQESDDDVIARIDAENAVIEYQDDKGAWTESGPLRQSAPSKEGDWERTDDDTAMHEIGTVDAPESVIIETEESTEAARVSFVREGLQKRLQTTNENENKKRDKGGKRPLRKGPYKIPVEEVLADYGKEEYWQIDRITQKLGETLKRTLEEFKITAEVTGIQKGPVITMFEILPAPGVKLSKIVNLADNIALRLAAPRVRIVAPIPGKHAVGIEVPNKHRSIVSLREVISDPDFQKQSRGLPIALGKDITGVTRITDLTQMPHLLIAGATGSGKSVCVNSIICSILFTQSPAEARLILIDPKIVELKYYNDIPHLLTPVITDPKKAYQALQYCIAEMEHRYSLLDALCVRDISAFNKKAAAKTHTIEPMPHIIVIIDEFADLIATSGKDMESTLARLAAMSRAVGIHIVLATQRPSIDVITGLIKANIPSRIAFMVAGKFDSRIIIDAVGAEKLLGQGDMLFIASQDPFPVRIQGAYISDTEVERLVEYVKGYGEPDYIDDEIFIEEETAADFGTGEMDPLLDSAIDIVIAAGKASTSYLQRKLKIGYNRAARLVEELEIRGIVGPQNGSKARDVIHVPSKTKG